MNDLSVELISRADGDLVKVTENVKVCKSDVCSTLESYAVTCCNAVEPADSSRTSGRCTLLALVAAPVTELFCNCLIKDLADERAAADT